MVAIPAQRLIGFFGFFEKENVSHSGSARGFGAIDCVLPGLESSSSRSGAHATGETPVGPPDLRQRVSIFPDARPEPGQKARSGHGGLDHLWPHDVTPQVICLQLHEQVIGGRPSIHFQFAHSAPQVAFHGA